MPTPEVLAGLGRFREQFRAERERLERLATAGQAPLVLFIACTDSRVAPELITGAGLGDLFVVRTLGNLVPAFGTGEVGTGAAIEYAVLHLHVRHAIVCGHTRCGSLEALDEPPDWSREPHIARWIEHARPARTKVQASGLPLEEQPLAAARENVLLQMENLRSYDAVRDAERAGALAVHGWMYQLETGEVEEYDAATGTWRSVGGGSPPSPDSAPGA